MSDTREVGDPAEEIGRLSAQLKDLESTILARLTTRPTGDIEPTLRTTPKPGTLLLNGQTVSRTQYAALWAWVQQNNLVRPGLFTNGDGSTTFGLPNFSGRVPIGAGTLGSDTYQVGDLVGEARVTLTVNQMPSHTHSGSTSSESHSHSGTANSAGGHGGHVNPANVNHNSGDGAHGVHGHPPTWGFTDGGHTHSISINSASHSHSLSIGSAGGGQPHENRQPSIAINWLIWT